MIRINRDERLCKRVNPFEIQGKWFKANLHTHSTKSDGEKTLAERTQEYRDRGYRVLAITDHEVTHDVSELSTEDFLVISGMETHPKCPFEADFYHLVCLNVPYGFEFKIKNEANAQPHGNIGTDIATSTVSKIVNAVNEVGGEVFFAHPSWNGFNINHMLAIDGYIAIEIYNACASKFGKAYSTAQWDDLLNAGRMVSGIAVDDAHDGNDIFMGWTMIKAKGLTIGEIMNALRSGAFYSSCGPIIKDFRVNDGQAEIQCSPVNEIHFTGLKYFGQSFYAGVDSDNDTELTCAKSYINTKMKFIRAEIVDRNGNRAWSNPIEVRT